MSYADNPYRTFGDVAAQAQVDERVDFIRKTYLHLAGAVFAFAALAAVFLNLPFTDEVMASLFRARFGWLFVVGGFVLVSWVADAWARSSTSVGLQYAGLGLYVLAEAVIFTPILWIASSYFPGQHLIETAGLITLLLFGGLTLSVFVTGHDFSYLRSALWLGGLAAMGTVVASIIFGFSLGIVFSALMIVLASGYILYDTSNVMHHYRIGQHVAASLALFASVALMFYYVLRLLMALQSRD
jgi:FtsH-binding integral membrane protein